MQILSDKVFVLENFLSEQTCDFLAESFSKKEPDTLAWIDLIPEGSLIWDIGANVGLYSVYAAKARNCKV